MIKASQYNTTTKELPKCFHVFYPDHHAISEDCVASQHEVASAAHRPLSASSGSDELPKMIRALFPTPRVLGETSRGTRMKPRTHPLIFHAV